MFGENIKVRNMCTFILVPKSITDNNLELYTFYFCVEIYVYICFGYSMGFFNFHIICVKIINGFNDRERL